MPPRSSGAWRGCNLFQLMQIQKLHAIVGLWCHIEIGQTDTHYVQCRWASARFALEKRNMKLYISYRSDWNLHRPAAITILALSLIGMAVPASFGQTELSKSALHQSAPHCTLTTACIVWQIARQKGPESGIVGTILARNNVSLRQHARAGDLMAAPVVNSTN
jgi:hypothetical protein